MAQEYSSIELNNAPRFDEVVGEVQRTHRTRIIKRADAPVAIITPVQIRPGDPAAKERFFQIVDEIQEQNKDKDPDEIEADIAAAVKEVRDASGATDYLRHGSNGFDSLAPARGSHYQVAPRVR